MQIEIRKYISFLFVGGLGAVSYIVLAYLLTLTGLAAWLSSLIAYAGLVPVIYLLQKNIVFSSSVSHSYSFPRYFSVQVIAIAISAILPFILKLFQIAPIVSFFLVAIFVAIVNYMLQNRWVFSTR